MGRGNSAMRERRPDTATIMNTSTAGYLLWEGLGHGYQGVFCGTETVMHSLGRYTHRIAISNSRILRMDENTVTIKVKDYKSGGQWKELTLDGVEFVRRFLMHGFPKEAVPAPKAIG